MLIVHALALAAAQAAPTPADQADAKCVFAMTMLGEGAAEADKPGLDMTMSFFMSAGGASCGRVVDSCGGRGRSGAIGEYEQYAE